MLAILHYNGCSVLGGIYTYNYALLQFKLQSSLVYDFFISKVTKVIFFMVTFVEKVEPIHIKAPHLAPSHPPHSHMVISNHPDSYHVIDYIMWRHIYIICR